MAAGKRKGTGGTGGAAGKKVAQLYAVDLRSMREALPQYAGPGREDMVPVAEGSVRKAYQQFLEFRLPEENDDNGDDVEPTPAPGAVEIEKIQPVFPGGNPGEIGNRPAQACDSGGGISGSAPPGVLLGDIGRLPSGKSRSFSTTSSPGKSKGSGNLCGHQALRSQ